MMMPCGLPFPHPCIRTVLHVRMQKRMVTPSIRTLSHPTVQNRTDTTYTRTFSYPRMQDRTTTPSTRTFSHPTVQNRTDTTYTRTFSYPRMQDRTHGNHGIVARTAVSVSIPSRPFAAPFRLHRTRSTGPASVLPSASIAPVDSNAVITHVGRPPRTVWRSADRDVPRPRIPVARST